MAPPLARLAANFLPLIDSRPEIVGFGLLDKCLAGFDETAAMPERPERVRELLQDHGAPRIERDVHGQPTSALRAARHYLTRENVC